MRAFSLWRVMAACVFFAAPSLAIAQGDEPVSLAGQTLTLIVSGHAGGGSDFQGRLVARYMPKYLPGNPKIIVQNVPGGGGIKGLKYFLEINPGTDLSFALIASSMPFRARTGKVPAGLFDPQKTSWIGSASDSTNYCAFGTGIYEALGELKDKQFTLGATERSGIGYAAIQIVSETLDWKPKIVTGYGNNQTLALAVERGEIDGSCGSMATYPMTMGPVIDKGAAKVAFYFGPHRRDDINAPYLFDLPMSPEQAKFAKIALASISFGRPFALHPDADPSLLPIFRDAFKATVEDAELLAEAEKENVVIRYTSGEEIETAVKDLYAAPDELISKTDLMFAE